LAPRIAIPEKQSSYSHKSSNHRILSFGLLVGRTSQSLRDRYVEPDIERFAAARDIGLTVEYGSDGLACQMVIERKELLLLDRASGWGDEMSHAAIGSVAIAVRRARSRARLYFLHGMT